MKVFAQPTDFNLRLCSLLSAVMNRPLRPDFVPAILNKADMLRDRRSEGSMPEREHLGVVFVGPGIIIESMSKSAPRFCTRYELDVATVPVEIQSKKPLVATLNATLQMLEKSIHFFHQTKRPVVVVAVTSGVDVVYHILNIMTTEPKVLGVLAVDPMHSRSDVISLAPPCGVPIIIVNSRNKNGEALRHQQIASNHANIILIQYADNTNMVSGIEWDEATMEDYPMPPTMTMHQTFWIWILRTIAKYSEALGTLHLSDGLSPSTRDSLGDIRLKSKL